MTDKELKDIAVRIQLDGWTGCAVPLLRSIEIAALREALEVVEKAEKVYDFEGVPIRNPAAYDLETTIRTIELQ